MATDKVLKATLMLSAVDNMTRVVNNAVDKSSRAMRRLETSAQGVADLFTGAFMTDVAVSGLRSAITAAEEAEVAHARLAQVFRSMGEQNDNAAESAANYAAKLETQLGVEAEQIMAAQAKLATFSQVSNATARMSGVFDRATQAAFDLAAAGFGDAASASVQLGKALQDPVKGITALRKSGVSFTEAEQKKIKTLVASGKTLEAQNMILKAVEMQVGGVAAATATDSARMALAFGEIEEAVGKGLLPALRGLVTGFVPIIKAFAAFLEANPKMVQAIVGIGAALLVFGGIMQITTGIVAIFNTVVAMNPFVLLAMAVIAVAVLIYTYFDEIVAFMRGVWDRLKKPIQMYIGVYVAAWRLVLRIIDIVRGWFSRFAAWIGSIFVKIGKAWERIKVYFSAMRTYIVDLWTGLLDWFGTIPGRMYDAGVNMITALWDGIKSVASMPVNAVKDIVSSIRDYFPFSPAKVGPLRDIHKIKLMETVAGSIKPQPVLQAVERSTSAISQGMQGVGTAGGFALAGAGGGGGGMVLNFTPTINVGAGAGPSAGADIRTALTQFVPELVKEIERFMERNNRKKF